MKKEIRKGKRDKTTQIYRASRLEGVVKNAGIKPRKKLKKNK